MQRDPHKQILRGQQPARRHHEGIGDRDVNAPDLDLCDGIGRGHYTITTAVAVVYDTWIMLPD